MLLRPALRPQIRAEPPMAALSYRGLPVPPDLAQLEADVRLLGAIERPSASEGERDAAELIASQLRVSAQRACVERESAHGSYWWPLGLLNAISLVGGALALPDGPRRGARRLCGAAAGLFATAGLWDDLSVRHQWFRRRFLPHRATWNVVAQAGDDEALNAVVVVAHHDAAHSGLIFAPGLPELIGERLPRVWDRVNRSPPLMYLVIGGPLLITLGSLLGRRGLLAPGLALAGGSALTFAEIGARRPVAGANDNLSGVAVMLALARALQDDPVHGLRVMLVSTGSEESFEEGMRGFATRHLARMPRDRTHIIVVDTVGSPTLALPEAEGMLILRDYDAALKELFSTCALEIGVKLRRGLRFSFSSDAQIGLSEGFPTVMLGSVNRYKTPSNYHWPTDTPENVDYGSVADAARLVEAVVRRLAELASVGRGAEAREGITRS